MMENNASFSYDESARRIKFNIPIDENLGNIDALNENHELAFQLVKLYLSKGEARNMLNYMIGAGLGLEAILTGSMSGKNAKFVFSHDELKCIKENLPDENSLNEEILKCQIDLTNSFHQNFVFDGENVVTIKRVYDDGQNLIFEEVVKEEYFERLREWVQSGESRNGIKRYIDDPVGRQSLQMVVKNGKGIIYQYIGEKSGKTFYDVHTPEDISRYI